MTDYYWIGGDSGGASDALISGNWSLSSGGTPLTSGGPDDGDVVIFDSGMSAPCQIATRFPDSSGVLADFRCLSTQDQFVEFTNTNTNVVTNKLTLQSTGFFRATAASKIEFRGGGTSGVFIFFNSANFATNPNGFWGTTKGNVTLDFGSTDANTAVKLENGVYPNLTFVGNTNSTTTFSPTAVTAAGTNTYPTTDILNFTTDSDTSVVPATKNQADLSKVFRIHGNITAACADFNWGNTTLEIQPQDTNGSKVPYNGVYSASGNFQYGTTAKIFKAKYNHLRIAANSGKYFEMDEGAILSCNKLTILPDARFYGPDTTVNMGAEIQCVELPTILGDWNFSQIAEGIYRTRSNPPPYQEYHSILANNLGSNGQVLAISSSGELEWSSTAGGGGVTVQDEGSTVGTTADILNFTGNGVVATGSGATKTITITDTDTNTNQLTTFDIGVDTNTNATTISHGETLTFTGGTGISTETTADGTVTITNDSPNVFSGSIAATQVAYGSGANAITGESDFTYDATNDLLEVDKIKSHIIIEVQNDTGSSIPKGQAVYVDAEGTHPSVAPALATNAAKMPSIGLTQEALATTGVGYVCVNGIITISTSVIDDTLSDPGDVGKTLYVSETTAGNLTITKPTSPNDLVQNVGKIADINGTNVKVIVSNIGRSNDVPNTISIEGDITTTTGDLTVSAGQASFTIDDATNVPLTVEQDGNGDIAVFKGDSDELLTVRRPGSLFWNLSTAGGGTDENIMTYRDTAGSERNFMSVDAGTIVLHNRGPDGDVEIRANTSTAGSSGEVSVAQFEDSIINLKVPTTLTSTTSDQLKINYDGDDKFALHVGTDRVKFRHADTGGTLKDVLMFKENGTGIPRVGINEADPDTMLHVGGNIKMESSAPILYVGTTASSGSQAELKLHGARNSDGNPIGQIVFSNNDNSGTNTGTYEAAKIFAFNDGGDKAGGLQFQTVPAGSSTTLATALTIQEDTNIVTAGNLTVGGNLIVSGDSITVNAETITTEEAMLSLGIGQTATDADALDFGFYGTYDVSDTQKYRGLFADASDSGKFKLFKDLEAEPTTTVNVSGTGYAVGTLVANLEGDVTGNLTGSADSATVATRVVVTDNESTNESNALVFVADADVDGALDAALESDGDLTYNPSTGVVTATGFAGALTGDVTGNVSGTAATVTDATQSAITSVGTLTSLGISGDLTVDTSTLKVDSTNNRVGIGTTSPDEALEIMNGALKITREETEDSVLTEDDVSLSVAGGLKWTFSQSFDDPNPVPIGTTTDNDVRILRNNGTAHYWFWNDSRSYMNMSLEKGTPTFKFRTTDTDIAANDVLGQITFSAPYEGTGTDALLDAGIIKVLAEGDFSASSNASAMTFSTGASEAATEKMRITSAGKVGIGLTNPAAKLTVDDSILVSSSGDTTDPKTEGILQRITGTTDDNPSMEIFFVENHGLNYGFRMHYDGANNRMRFFTHDNNTSGSEVMRFNRAAAGDIWLGPSGSKVMIGSTSSPTFPLHLKYTDNRTDPEGSGSSTGAGAIGADAEGGGLYIENTSTTDGSWSGITFRTDTADGRIAYQSVGSSLVNEGQMSFFCDANDSPNQYTLEEVLRLRGGGSGAAQTFNSAYINGRLGIGTSSPDDILHVKGTDAALLVEDAGADSNPAVEIKNDAVHWKLQARGGDSDKFRIVEGSNTHAVIDTSGNVGIGTASPSMPLHVESAENDLALFKSTDANAGIKIDTPDDGYAVVFFSEAGTNKWSLGKTANASDAFSIYDETNSRPVMQIAANNTVTFNQNNVSTADFIIEAQGNSNMFRLDSSQSNIGIGMAPPSGHGGQTVVMTVRGDDDGIALMLQNSAADADDGPEMVFYRNSASPAADDLLGRIRFDGEDSGDNIHTYFRMTSAIIDPTDASEDGRFMFENRVGGALSEVMRFEGIDVKIPTDSGKLYLGASDDLAIYHDGSNSYVADAGTGELRLLGSNIKLRNAAGNEEYITCVDNGEVILYHNNSAKLTTSSIGVTVTGKLSATTKSFDIEHPTKEGMRLHHGSLEGPEHGVYIRGKNNSGTIHLPDYWKGLVDKDTITVQLTAIGKPQELYVREIKNNRVRVAAKSRGTHLNYFYFIQAERKDVEKMVVEY